MWSFQYAWAMVQALDEAKETAHAEAVRKKAGTCRLWCTILFLVIILIVLIIVKVQG